MAGVVAVDEWYCLGDVGDLVVCGSRVIGPGIVSGVCVGVGAVDVFGVVGMVVCVVGVGGAVGVGVDVAGGGCDVGDMGGGGAAGVGVGSIDGF